MRTSLNSGIIFFGGAIILITFVKVEFTVIGLGREFELFCKF